MHEISRPPLYQLLIARANCHRHLMRKARLRGIALTPAEVTRIERAAALGAPAFERPGFSRYVIRIRRGRRTLRFVYDAGLRCLVTVWDPSPDRLAPRTRRSWDGKRGFGARRRYRRKGE